MNTYILTELNLINLVKFLDECKKEDDILLIVNSGGGACWEFYAVEKRLNEMLEQGYKITMEIYYIASAAFNMAYGFKGKRIIGRDGDGMVHMDRIEIAHNKVVCEADETARGRYKWMAEHDHEDYPFLSEKELELYKEGRDVYIDHERMKKIFEQS